MKTNPPKKPTETIETDSLTKEQISEYYALKKNIEAENSEIALQQKQNRVWVTKANLIFELRQINYLTTQIEYGKSFHKDDTIVSSHLHDRRRPMHLVYADLEQSLHKVFSPVGYLFALKDDGLEDSEISAVVDYAINNKWKKMTEGFRGFVTLDGYDIKKVCRYFGEGW